MVDNISPDSAHPLAELAEYLDFLEGALIALDVDMKLGDITSPGIWADRIRAQAATPSEDDAEQPYVDMLWRWFEKRRGVEDMRSERAFGLSADDFKNMLDEHEQALLDSAQREPDPDYIKLAEERISQQGRELARLRAGLESIVNCRNPLTRAAVREACAEILAAPPISSTHSNTLTEPK